MKNNSAPTSTEDRALTLLGAGVAPAQVAASLGISESRISQLLSDENFAAQVAERRFTSLQKHNLRDASYDEVEDALLEKLRDCLPLMHKPMEILKAIATINAAKRRGTSAPEFILEKQQVLTLVMPVQIINKFTTNQQGQVTTIESEAGSQNLLTIQSGSLDSLVSRVKGSANETPRLAGNQSLAGCS